MRSSSGLTLSCFFLLAAAITFSGCSRERSVEAAREPEPVADANDRPTLWANEAEFKEYAAGMHAGEINMAELAKQKSRNRAVRDYADAVIDGHTDALKELSKSIGQDRNSIKGSFDTMNHIGDLSLLQGAEFDRLFIDLMIADHKDARETFREQLDAAQDGEFADYLRNSLPTLEKRLERAQELKNDLDKGRATED